MITLRTWLNSVKLPVEFSCVGLGALITACTRVDFNAAVVAVKQVCTRFTCGGRGTCQWIWKVRAAVINQVRARHIYRIQSDVGLYVGDLENVRAISRFKNRPNGRNIVSYSHNNNVNRQHPHKRCRRHRQPWSGWSFEQLPKEFTANAAVKPNHIEDVNTDGDKDVSHFCENINRCRCSARPKDPEDVGFSVDMSYITDDFLQADITTCAVNSVLPNIEYHGCTFHMM